MIVLKVLVIFGVFGFFFTFLREVVKDIEDIEGDKAMESRTLPIVLGIPKTKTVVIIVASLVFVSLIISTYLLYDHNHVLSIYLLIATALPLLFFIFQIAKADSKKQFKQMSTLLKIIMLTGILSMIFI
jgi:4-hydroxybenzoate polyprenyltransferase